MSSIDLTSATPSEIYEAVKAMDSAEFDGLMEEPESRDLITRALVGHMAGLFRPEKAGDLEAVIHVKLWDKPGGGYDHFEMQIANGTCVISDEPGDEARMTLKIRPLATCGRCSPVKPGRAGLRCAGSSRCSAT